jgi:hypothetical protein
LTARARRRLVVLAAALAIVSHVVFWYLPRARPATPSPGASAALAAPGARLTVWIPFPHQNLGAIDDRLATLEARLAGLAGAGEERLAELPSFGPFAVPPARELVLAVDADGGRSAELAVYPVVRWLARAAGVLAGNPWLAGGDLPNRPGERVVWRDGRWCWRRGGPDAHPPAVPATGAVPESFALVRTGAAIGPLPAGLYRLVSGGASGTLELLAGEPPARRAAADPLEPVGWWIERTAAADALRGVAVWEAFAGIDGVPAMATLARGPAGAPEFDLPGEQLLDLVGAEVPAGERGGVRVRALDRPTLDRGLALAVELAGRVGDGSGLDVAASADADRLVELLERFAEHLRRVPLVGGSEAREVERAAALLAPLAGSGRMTIEVGAGAAWVRLTLGIEPSSASSPGDVPMDRDGRF